MKEVKHVGEVFNKAKLDYIEFIPTIPSNDVVICLHGQGERAVKVVSGRTVAVTDGSKLDLVKKLGYPKHATAGFEFPFNIIAPQCGVSYSGMLKFLLLWAKAKYPNGKIFVTGLSLGGIATYGLLKSPGIQYVTSMAPVCGKAGIVGVELCAKIPMQAWHGTKDTTVSYTADCNFIKAYNTCFCDCTIELVSLVGVAHNAWDQAYSVTPGKDKLLQWFISKK